MPTGKSQRHSLYTAFRYLRLSVSRNLAYPRAKSGLQLQSDDDTFKITTPSPVGLLNYWDSVSRFVSSFAKLTVPPTVSYIVG